MLEKEFGGLMELSCSGLPFTFCEFVNRKQFHTIIDDLLLITLDFSVAVFCDTADGAPEAEKVRVFELELYACGL